MKDLWKGMAIAGIWIGTGAIAFSPAGVMVIMVALFAFLGTVAIANS